MKLNKTNKKISSLLFSILMITTVFAGFVTPAMATDEELESANITYDATTFNENSIIYKELESANITYNATTFNETKFNDTNITILLNDSNPNVDLFINNETINNAMYPFTANVMENVDVTNVVNTNIAKTTNENILQLPRIIGSVNTSSARSVYISGNHAFVADWWSGLQIIDISNPSSPFIIGNVDTPGGANGVFISGNHAFVADYRNSGLQIIDISNLSSPFIVGSVDTPGGARDVCISGNHAFVADAESGLQIIDISNLSSPTIVSSVDTPIYAQGLFISGNHAFVADWWSGLQIIDISNPNSSFIIGSVNTSDMATDVFISGNHAFVADWWDGLQIIDISDPSSPAIVSNVDTPNWARSVFVSGNHAFVADRFGGDLQIIDISNPSSPFIVGSVDIPDEAQSVFVSGNHAFVADLHDGLQIIDISAIVDGPIKPEPNPEPISLIIAPEITELNIIDTQQFNATVLPEGTNQSVTWSVDNETIGTINVTTGFFTALAEGTVNVTATSVVNETIIGTAIVTVANLIESANITFSNLYISPLVGEMPHNIIVTALVKNTGGEAGEFTANLTIDGIIVNSTIGTLGAGENTTISFTHTIDTAGTYDVTINTLLPVTVIVTELITEPANITHSNLIVTPDSGYAPLDITATANFENTGESIGEFNATFVIDGGIVDYEIGTLDAAEITTVNFTHTIDTAGNYSIGISELTPVTVTVTEHIIPANITHSNLIVTPDSGYAPLVIVATALVENTGGEAGDFNATFMIDGTIVDYTTGTLNATENTTVSFTHTLDVAGIYNVTIDALAPTIITVITPPDNFTLTTNTVGGGTVIRNPDQIEYVNGTVVSLTA
ncbi:MAG: hypothetical protein HF967_10110, partial [Methanosarcinales archaeon]|nr:hypothetical protein [Methanosarcinales archaeon]